MVKTIFKVSVMVIPQKESGSSSQKKSEVWSMAKKAMKPARNFDSSFIVLPV